MQRFLVAMCRRGLILGRGLWRKGELGSPFSWVDESSEDDLDYFVGLDLAASESLLRSVPCEALATSTDARLGDS